MEQVITGIERLAKDRGEQERVVGNIGILCHAASVTSDFTHTVTILQKIYGNRLKAILGPQHGFVTDVQDNMMESDNFIHPYFKLPVYSLYSTSRKPTTKMLENIDTLIIDLQDVGTRVYTYISTMALAMEACAEHGVKVVILDRPNPVGGSIIEGNVREDEFFSFVGHHPIPMRHGLTMGEMALFTQQFCNTKCELEIIEMKNWKRTMFFEQTGLPWVLPSPNLPTSEGAKTFIGTVIFEGTNISEGRGTTRSLEIIGHPLVKPYELKEELDSLFLKYDLEGFILRPLNFFPTFQKYQGKTCGGFQIHVTDNITFRPWRVAQLICQTLYVQLGNDFSWNKKPYEYEFKKIAIDLINGSESIRKWVETKGSFKDLCELEKNGLETYTEQREQVLLY